MMEDGVNDIDMNIARTLGIDPSPVPVGAPVQEVLPVRTGGYTAQDADRDYSEVRRNLKCLIEKSQEAIEGIVELARDSQQPRAYEVVAQLVQSSLEANTRLIDLHRRMKDIRREEVTNKTTNVTNNSIYVGSTAELQKMINAQRKAIQDGKEAASDKGD
jgi:hypothetical protein